MGLAARLPASLLGFVLLASPMLPGTAPAAAPGAATRIPPPPVPQNRLQ